MRTIRIILIILVLVGFPALSWYYLSSGLKWRVTAQDETVKKERLGQFTLLQKDSVGLSASDLEGLFYLMVTPTDSASMQHLEMIHSQFHVRSDFKILSLSWEDNTNPTGDSTWIKAICTSGCESLRGTLFGKDYTAAIVDDSLYIRGRYHLASVVEMRKLVEHLAVVLPIDKRERIELKRGNQ